MHPRLQELINSMETIQKSIPEDLNLCVLDQEKLLAKLPGKRINLPFEVGDTFERKLKDSVTHSAKLQGEMVRQERGSEFLGIAYIATSVPVLYDASGEIVGFFTTVTSNQKAAVMQKSADELSSTLEEVVASSEQMTLAS